MEHTRRHSPSRRVSITYQQGEDEDNFGYNEEDHFRSVDRSANEDDVVHVPHIATDELGQNHDSTIYLNIYDLHPYNKYLNWAGLGAYHSAVQLFGFEYR